MFLIYQTVAVTLTRLTFVLKLFSQENKLYWCDARTHRIERIHLDSGKEREIILKDNNADLFSVAVYGSYLYWSDR